MQVRVKLLPGGTMPVRASAGAAGLDCFAPRGGCVHVRGRAVIPLGFCLEIPTGWAAHPVSRSGLAKEWGVVEYWGTIDSDYRGEAKAMLFNHGQEAYRWEAGDRVCQLLFIQVPPVELVQVDELGETARGPRGFGSTGDKAIQSSRWADLGACGHGPIYPPGCDPIVNGWGPSSIGYSGMPYHDLGLQPVRGAPAGTFDVRLLRDVEIAGVRHHAGTILSAVRRGGGAGIVFGHGAIFPLDPGEYEEVDGVLSRALRPYRVLDGDPSVGAVPCPSCGATFAHVEGCPETAVR